MKVRTIKSERQTITYKEGNRTAVRLGKNGGPVIKQDVTKEYDPR